MPDATKYPPSTHRVRVRQVSESKSLVGSRSRDYGCCRIFPSSPAPCLNCGGGDRWCRSPTCFGLWQLSFLPFEKDTTTTTEVENAKKAQKKVPSDYWLLEHYDILKVQGVRKLIVPVPGAKHIFSLFLLNYCLMLAIRTIINCAICLSLLFIN
ncbi:hypothetical protein TNCV_691001 [Trichonephila clavipes]|nr:hypothetical protein TNCV_691001 [Trichonephila clavipes]